jgi:uracil-DNA glycosylase family 4
VRCVPPENKPLPVEINTCRQFLSAQLSAMPNLKAVLTLGRVAHDSVLSALAIPKKGSSLRTWRAPRYRPHRTDRELSLLALQHEYRRAHGGDVRQRRGGAKQAAAGHRD